MKAGMASVPDRVLRIVAVTGSLALLPGMAFATPAHESLGVDGDFADTSAPGPIDFAPCVSAEMATAPLQLPPEDPDVPTCPYEDEEQCARDARFRECIAQVMDEYDECVKDAGFWGRQGCKVERAGGAWQCAIEAVMDFWVR